MERGCAGADDRHLTLFNSAEDVSAAVRRLIAAGVRVHLGLLQFRIADMLSTSHLFTAAFRHLEEARQFGKDVISHQGCWMSQDPRAEAEPAAGTAHSD